MASAHISCRPSEHILPRHRGTDAHVSHQSIDAIQQSHSHDATPSTHFYRCPSIDAIPSTQSIDAIPSTHFHRWKSVDAIPSTQSHRCQFVGDNPSMPIRRCQSIDDIPSMIFHRCQSVDVMLHKTEWTVDLKVIVVGIWWNLKGILGINGWGWMWNEDNWIL